MTEEEFRDQLQIITTGRSADEWPRMIADLGPAYPHSIREVDLGDRRFNCFAYALGLHTSANYFRIAALSASPNVFANTSFVQELVGSGFLVPTGDDSDAQHLVLYSHNTDITHAGIHTRDRVTSKWGTGRYFEHALLEVPANYGNEFACYETPSPERVETAFIQFAERQGVKVSMFVGRSYRGG